MLRSQRTALLIVASSIAIKAGGVGGRQIPRGRPGAGDRSGRGPAGGGDRGGRGQAGGGSHAAGRARGDRS